jgi:hypothetical protein
MTSNKNNSDKKNISISDIRNLYGFNENQLIEWNEFYEFYKKEYEFDKYFIEMLYIHYLLIIGNYTSIHKFIIDFINSSSIDNFENFINLPLYIPIHKIGNKEYYNNEMSGDKIYHLYPITTYIMWNNNPDILRLLVSFGTVLDKTDNLNYYPEEAITHIPYFNPIPHLEKIEKYSVIENMNKGDIYYRNIDEFKNVINEVKYITGEDVSKNWFYPI